MSTDKTCKLCHKNPRYTDESGRTSLYCGNSCAKRAGAPLPNPESLVKRSKDLDLGGLLEQEAAIEREKTDPTERESITSLVNSGIWRVESIPGQTDVILTRDFCNEQVRVQFCMAELDPFEPDDESDDENGGAERPAGPHQLEGCAKDEDSDSDDDISDEPVECTISISKPSKGALLFECYAWPLRLEVLKISYIKDERLVSQDTGEAERQLRAAGVGPEYDGLPKRIKEEFTKYLSDRGIDGALAQFISDYIKYKTQKEAQGWFDAVGSFVSGA